MLHTFELDEASLLGVGSSRNAASRPRRVASDTHRRRLLRAWTGLEAPDVEEAGTGALEVAIAVVAGSPP